MPKEFDFGTMPASKVIAFLVDQIAKYGDLPCLAVRENALRKLTASPITTCDIPASHTLNEDLPAMLQGGKQAIMLWFDDRFVVR
jgi:hypothetical protein